MNGDLQPAEAPVSLNHPGLHKQDSVMESELLLVKNEMPLRTEDHGKGPGRMKVLGHTARAAAWAETSLTFLQR